MYFVPLNETNFCAFLDKLNLYFVFALIKRTDFLA